MNTKNDVEVIINGKQYTLSGYESSEYLQKIANHINDKIAEFKQQESYLRLDTEMRNILLAINLSDEYYKAIKDSNDLKNENEDMEKEIFYSEYAAKVYFWEDLTIFDVAFGHGMGIRDYDKLSRAEKNKIVIPYKQMEVYVHQK